MALEQHRSVSISCGAKRPTMDTSQLSRPVRQPAARPNTVPTKLTISVIESRRSAPHRIRPTDPSVGHDPPAPAKWDNRDGPSVL